MDRAPIDVENPYCVLAEHIRRNKLQYDMLRSLAVKYYPQRTLLHLAHTASAGGMQT